MPKSAKRSGIEHWIDFFWWKSKFVSGGIHYSTRSGAGINGIRMHCFFVK